MYVRSFGDEMGGWDGGDDGMIAGWGGCSDGMGWDRDETRRETRSFLAGYLFCFVFLFSGVRVGVGYDK